jgi:hypothetical protein
MGEIFQRNLRKFARADQNQVSTLTPVSRKPEEFRIVPDIVGGIVELIRQGHKHTVFCEVEHFASDHSVQQKSLRRIVQHDFHLLKAVVQAEFHRAARRDGQLLQGTVRVQTAMGVALRFQAYFQGHEPCCPKWPQKALGTHRRA